MHGFRLADTVNPVDSLTLDSFLNIMQLLTVADVTGLGTNLPPTDTRENHAVRIPSPEIMGNKLTDPYCNQSRMRIS